LKDINNGTLETFFAMIGGLLQIFCYNYCGRRLTDKVKNFIIFSTDFWISTKKFEELHEALYDANWWNLSQKNKKHFLIILGQLQTPVYIDSPLGNWSFSTMETVSCFVIIESSSIFFFISDVSIHLFILQYCHSSVQQMNFMSCSIIDYFNHSR
jgi:hypothetical protein